MTRSSTPLRLLMTSNQKHNKGWFSHLEQSQSGSFLGPKERCPLRSRLYALPSGLPKTTSSNLQLIHNTEAGLLTKTRRKAHRTPLVKSLLPVLLRTDVKIFLVFKCLHGPTLWTPRSSGVGLVIRLSKDGKIQLKFSLV